MHLTPGEREVVRKIELNRKANPAGLDAREWLEKCGLSREALSRKFGCSESMVNSVMSKLKVERVNLQPERDQDSWISKSKTAIPNSLVARKRFQDDLLGKARAGGPVGALARVGLEELFGMRFEQG